MMLDERHFSRFLSTHEIQATVESLAEVLNKDYEGKHVVFVCVLKGGFMFCADLIRKLKMPFEIEFVRLSSIRSERVQGGTVTILKDIATDIRGKHVVILEEIIDSGRKLRFLRDRLKASQPASVEVLTFLDKAKKRVVDVPVKYVGRAIEDHFLVGYGLDLEERARNLPEIHYLKYPN